MKAKFLKFYPKYYFNVLRTRKIRQYFIDTTQFITLALRFKITQHNSGDIPLNHKMAPASDWLFFCSSSVKIQNNSSKVFRNWHAQTFGKCCTRFYLDWRRRGRIERRKLFLPDTVCIDYILYLLSSLEASFELSLSIYIY